MISPCTFARQPNIRRCQRHRSLSFVFLSALFCWGTVLGQSTGPGQATAMSVKEALLLSDGNEPGHVSPLIEVVGTLTSEPTVITEGETLAFFQDPTGGVSLISTNGSLTAGRFLRGDVLKVIGQVRYHLGTPEMTTYSVQRLRTGATPQPRQITVAAAMSGRYSGELVSIAGKILPTRSAQPIQLRDRFRDDRRLFAYGIALAAGSLGAVRGRRPRHDRRRSRASKRAHRCETECPGLSPRHGGFRICACSSLRDDSY